MKKHVLCIFTAILAISCTSPEDDAKIQSFWADQSAHLISKLPSSVLAAKAHRGRMPTFTEKEAQAAFESLGEETASAPTEQELNDMMKQWQETQAQLEQQPAVPPSESAPADTKALPKNTTKASAKMVSSSAKTGTVSMTKKQKPIEALLVVSSTCGWCQRLKQDQWAEKFQDKYWGQIKLVQYDVRSSDDRTLYNKFLRKHKLSSVGTPTLFIGDTKISGYPLPGADEAAQKAIAKYGVPSAPAKQYMEITMEDPSGVVRGKAPLKDRHAMQQAIEKVQKDNEKTLQDIGQMFGNATQAQAFAITSATEKALRQKAAASTSLQAYLAAQKQLLAQQEQNLNKLMQENAHFLRDIR